MLGGNNIKSPQKLKRLVAITSNGDRLMVKAPQKSIDLMEEGLKNIIEVVKVYRIACIIEDLIPVPEDYKPQYGRNKYWCPFCGGEHRFVIMEEGDYLFCEICGISDRDFYVRKMNRLDSHKLSDQKKQDKTRRADKRQKKLSIKKMKKEMNE